VAKSPWAWQRANEAAMRVYERPSKIKHAHGREIISALRDMYSATGDSRFLDALAAMTEHGFDRPHAGTWRIRERREERVCVMWMHDRLAGEKTLSVRQAAKRAAVAFWISGQSLDAVTKRLERAYRRAKPALTDRTVCRAISTAWTKGSPI
jgi:hypothetical protein